MLRRLLGAVTSSRCAPSGPRRAFGGAACPPVPGPDAEAAVLFTSGATGPAKGVVYRHGQLQAQLEAARAARYGLTSDDRLVAAFPPFALYGPALGIASSVPDVRAPGRPHRRRSWPTPRRPWTRPSSSPHPPRLRGVVATAQGLTTGHRAALGKIRLVVSAGAPVPAALLHAVGDILPPRTSTPPTA